MAAPEKSGARRADSPTKIVFGEALGALEESIRRAIADRAYELFQARGRDHGNDMRDWFMAEQELIKPRDVQIEDAGEQLSVRAKAPGFSAADVQIGLSPRRVIIWGQATRTDGPGRMQMLSEIDLPASVDPARASADVSDGVLSIVAAKAAGS